MQAHWTRGQVRKVRTQMQATCPEATPENPTSPCQHGAPRLSLLTRGWAWLLRADTSPPACPCCFWGLLGHQGREHLSSKRRSASMVVGAGLQPPRYSGTPHSSELLRSSMDVQS